MKRNEMHQARAVAFTKTRSVLPFLLGHLHSVSSRGRKRALWRKLQREPEPEPEPEVPLVADGVWLETVKQNELHIITVACNSFALSECVLETRFRNRTVPRQAQDNGMDLSNRITEVPP